MNPEKEDVHEEESSLAVLKMDKSRRKAVFTRFRNRMLSLCEEDSTPVEYKETLDKVETAMDNYVTAVHAIIDFCKTKMRTEDLKKAVQESETIDDQYEEMMRVYRLKTVFHDPEGEVTIKTVSETTTKVDSDMYKQLKRVSIPMFSGKKKDYEFWKSAFTACVDKTASSDEYKFLQLRQYLSGEALKCVEGLGHTAAAYNAAKERLERKFGGVRRKVNRFIEEIENFPVMKCENPKQIERFADLLDITIINMKENDAEDLSSNFMYQQLMKKLPESMIVRYQRWLHHNDEKESVETLKEWVLRESEFSNIAHEAKYGLDNNDQQEMRKKRSHTHFAANSGKRNKNCGVCNNEHETYQCEVLKSLDIPSRWAKAKEKNLCFRCLRNNHRGSECKRYKKCNINGCVKTHNRLLHSPDVEKTQNLNVNAPEFKSSSQNTEEQAFTSRPMNCKIALRTVPVIISNGKQKMKINALLDDGSSKSYLNEHVAYELGLDGEKETVNVNLLNGRTECFDTKVVEFCIESEDRQLKVNIEANTTKNVTGSLKAIDWNEHSGKWTHLSGIPFTNISKKSRVDLLIGIDFSDLHRSLKEVKGAPGEPIARLTPLGWTCVGPLECKQEETNMFSNFFISDHEDLNRMLKGFWEIDSYGTKMNDTSSSPMSLNDKAVLKNTEESMIYKDGHYEVKVPWKQKPILPNNYELALKRLESTKKKLKKDPYIEKLYKETIDNYVEKGYLRKVPEEEKTLTKWYLPHFPVIRLDRETTKVRIVFDASAKCKGVSLNDYIETGPKLQNDLFDVLLRFRKYQVAVACDISEMYLQVGISEPDRKYHRILWDDDEFEFTRLVFGINASPFLAQLVAQTNAKRFSEKYPNAAETVIKSTYMDDSLDSVPTEERGVDLYNQLSNLWLKAGMHARKWISNSVKVLENIPEEDRAMQINLETGYLPKTKALGVSWKAETDMFTFSLNKVSLQAKVTKRNLLKAVASMFDPLGFISPYVVTGKMFLQKLWLHSYDWDDEINPEVERKVLDWFSDMSELDNITVPRCLLFNRNELSVLHTFVDASEDAYSAVLYVRHENSENKKTTVMFVCSKTRVAPLAATSVPRLELMAAVLGLRIALTVGSTLELGQGQMIFWSDSVNVLYWISGQSRRYKPFVANRIAEIHENSIPSNWRHVPGSQNPADIASRGLSAEKLLEATLWWQGPDFLYLESDKWPENIIDPENIENKEQETRKKFIQTETYITDDSQIDDKLAPGRFSSWIRLIRIFAWVNRFINNCRSKTRTSDKALSADELTSAENRYIRCSQRESFPVEYKALSSEKPLSANSKLLSLNVKLDSDGIMRCDTRLKYAKYLPYNTRFPILLPRKHGVTRLIVKYYHELGEHSGTNQTLAALSTKFWLISGREEIREYEKVCTGCKRLKAQTSHQIMAPLPMTRTEKSMRAFAYCSVDFGGPFLTKQGRGKARQKRYLCLFTCHSSRAVHLEMALNMDTDSFLNAFYRMTCRRGTPKEIFSDNGTNFVGAYHELKELYEQINKEKIISTTAHKGIKWHFQPPSASHFGGVHEIMIKCAKRAVYSILKGADVTDEELQTAFIGAESLINSRPLSYQSSNPSDNTVLTPNHFLCGQLGGEFAPESVDTTVFDIRKRWRLVQEIVSHIWKRWLRELVPAIAGRKKWFREQQDYSTGDVVLVIDPGLPRKQWRLGRIVDKFPGVDGHTRVVTVRVGNSLMKRPVTRLCLIEKCTDFAL